MKIIDGCYSLKLECALRGLGFVEVGPIVKANAGLYFVLPVSYTWNCAHDDDLLGFQLRRPASSFLPEVTNHFDWPMAQTAKIALDMALGGYNG
jgi:hypothetical protein